MEITWIFRPAKLHLKKYVETTWIFWPAKLRRKKYVEGRGNSSKFGLRCTTWYPRRIDVDSTWCYRWEMDNYILPTLLQSCCNLAFEKLITFCISSFFMLPLSINLRSLWCNTSSTTFQKSEHVTLSQTKKTFFLSLRWDSEKFMLLILVL